MSIAPSKRRVARLVAVGVLLAGAAVACRPDAADPRASRKAPSTTLGRSAAVLAAVPAALTDVGLSLRAGPVAVPLQLRLPSLDVNAEILGVGITPTDVMDAPMGPADAAAWQQAFWYRGSAIPGARSTALIAAHANDSRGRAAPFARIGTLRPGDPIVVHDTRSGLDVRFAVTGSHNYSLAETSEPAVLSLIYGAGPVAGTLPVASADGLAHLTLITCSGTFKRGTHDHRLVVYATRVP